jgi:hypothetical protein
MCRYITGLVQEDSIRQKVPVQHSSLKMRREMSQMLTVWDRHFESLAEFKRRLQKTNYLSVYDFIPCEEIVTVPKSVIEIWANHLKPIRYVAPRIAWLADLAAGLVFQKMQYLGK